MKIFDAMLERLSIKDDYSKDKKNRISIPITFDRAKKIWKWIKKSMKN